MTMTQDTFEYDFALLAAPGDGDAARAVLEALRAAAENADALAVLEDISGAPMDKERLSKLVRCRAILLLCSPRSNQSAEITQRLACFKKLGRQDRVIPLLIEGAQLPPVCGAQNLSGGIVDVRADTAADFSARLQAALPSLLARLGIPIRSGEHSHAQPAHHVEQTAAQQTAPIKKDRKKRKPLIALAGLCLILICMLIALVSHRNELRNKSEADADERVALSRDYRNRAATMDAPAALELYKQSVDCLLPADGYPNVNAELVAAQRALGDSLTALGDYENADTAYTDMCARALKLHEQAGGKDALESLAAAEFHYAFALTEREVYNSAADYCRRALTRMQSLAGGGEDAAAIARLSDAYAKLGEILQRAGDFDAARDSLTQALIYRTQLSADGENVSLAALANAYYDLAQTELHAGDYEAARRYFDQCLIHYAPAASALGGQTLGHYLTLCALHALLFDTDAAQAVSDAEEAKTLMENDAFTDCVFACAAMFADRYQDSLSVFDTLINNGACAQIQNGFALLRNMGRAHPLMAEVEARLN